MEFRCTNCDQEYEVTQEYAGREFECTKCQGIVSVPADLFTEEPAVASNGPISNSEYNFGKCPKCHVALKQSAVICIECGHNLKLGMNAKTVVKAKKAGSFSLAVSIAAVTAIASGMIWAGIALWVGMEIGYVAWLIGLAVGGSVIVMTDERSVRLGVVAVALAIGAIMLGKVVYVSYALDDGMRKVLKSNPAILEGMITAEMIENNELDEKYLKWRETHFEITRQVLKRESKEMQQLIRQERGKIKKKLAALTPADKERFYTTQINKILGVFSYKDRLAASSSLWDLLWFFLAISTAWKMATGVRE
jgi:hypothetical protein